MTHYAISEGKNNNYFTKIFWLYKWTSLYARDKDSKNRLAYNEFAYKKTKNYQVEKYCSAPS